MIKKTITFKNMDGVEITEDWYFGLSPADVAELELTSGGRLSERLLSIGQSLEEHKDDEEKLVRANGAEIMQLFKELLMASVGKRSDDGRRFVKTDDLRDDFVQTGSYSELLMQLVTNPDEAADFVSGILPSEAIEKMQQGRPMTDVPLPEMPSWYTEGRVPTDDEIKGVQDPKLLQEAFRRKSAAIQ